MNILREVLDENGQHVLATLAGTSLANDFYLAGGTGLALLLGHRKSFDLDFFTHKPSESISHAMIESVIRKNFRLEQLLLVQREVDQITWDILGTKVSFIAYPFSLLEHCVDGNIIAPQMHGIKLATAREIALMKAYTIGRRAAFRDYVDIYFLLKQGTVSLDYILRHAPEKFTLRGEVLFSRKLFLEQLVYTKDAPDRKQAVKLILRDTISVEDVEFFLQEQMRRALRSLRTPGQGSEQ